MTPRSGVERTWGRPAYLHRLDGLKDIFLSLLCGASLQLTVVTYIYALGLLHFRLQFETTPRQVTLGLEASGLQPAQNVAGVFCYKAFVRAGTGQSSTDLGMLATHRLQGQQNPQPEAGEWAL